MTSTWIRSAPAATAAETSSASRETSAARIDGANLIASGRVLIEGITDSKGYSGEGHPWATTGSDRRSAGTVHWIRDRSAFQGGYRTRPAVRPSPGRGRVTQDRPPKPAARRIRGPITSSASAADRSALNHRITGSVHRHYDTSQRTSSRRSMKAG